MPKTHNNEYSNVGLNFKEANDDYEQPNDHFPEDLEQEAGTELKELRRQEEYAGMPNEYDVVQWANEANQEVAQSSQDIQAVSSSEHNLNEFESEQVAAAADNNNNPNIGPMVGNPKAVSRGRFYTVAIITGSLGVILSGGGVALSLFLAGFLDSNEDTAEAVAAQKKKTDAEKAAKEAAELEKTKAEEAKKAAETASKAAQQDKQKAVAAQKAAEQAAEKAKADATAAKAELEKQKAEVDRLISKLTPQQKQLDLWALLPDLSVFKLIAFSARHDPKYPWSVTTWNFVTTYLAKITKNLVASKDQATLDSLLIKQSVIDADYAEWFKQDPTLDGMGAFTLSAQYPDIQVRKDYKGTPIPRAIRLDYLARITALAIEKASEAAGQ